MLFVALFVLASSNGKTYAVIFAGAGRACFAQDQATRILSYARYYRMLGNAFHFMSYLEKHGVDRSQIRAFFYDRMAEDLHHKVKSFDDKVYGKSLSGANYRSDVAVGGRDHTYKSRIRQSLASLQAKEEDVLVVYLRSHGWSGTDDKGAGLVAPNGRHWTYEEYVSLVSEVKAGTVLFFIEGCSSCHILRTMAMEPLRGRNILFLCSATEPSRAGKYRRVNVLGQRVRTRTGGLLLPSLLRRLGEKEQDLTKIAANVLSDIRRDNGVVAVTGSLPRKGDVFENPGNWYYPDNWYYPGVREIHPLLQ